MFWPRVVLAAGMLAALGAGGSPPRTYEVASLYALACGKCYDGPDAHAFGDVGWWYPYMDADCSACNACHGNSQPGSCAQYHCGCGGETMRAMADSLGTLLAVGAHTQLLSLLSRRADIMAVDTDSTSIVLRDCRLKEALRIPLANAAFIESA
jgi:hypothetical protein